MDSTRHNANIQRLIIYLLCGMALLWGATGLAAEWGTILYPKHKTLIREKRSVNSKVKGKLNAGQPVRADFLRNSWYAVFKPTQKQRDEKRALGYVHASSFYRPPAAMVSSSSPVNTKSQALTSFDKVSVAFPPVDIKDISFKITEDGNEALCIEFNRFYMPALTTVQGEAPRIILSIPDVAALRKDRTIGNAEGKYISKILSSLDPQTHVARIVIHMKPSKDYSVNPAFYEKENMYMLEISEGNKSQIP